MLCPRKIQRGEDVNKLDWIQFDDGRNCNVTSRTTMNDARDIQTTIISVSKCNVQRASKALIKMLNEPRNANLKLLIKNAIITTDAPTTIDSVICQGLKDCLAYHTDERGGTRTTAAETLVKNTLMAATFAAVKDPSISNYSFATFLGTTWHQISLARVQASRMQEQDLVVSLYQRSVRSDFIREKVRLSVYNFCEDDDYTRLDTKQGKMEMKHPVTGETITVHRRIWRVKGKVLRLTLYKESIHYVKFRRENNDATVGYEIFFEALEVVGKYVCNPLPESCVDEKVSGVEQYMAATLCLIRKPHAKAELESYSGEGAMYDEVLDVLRKASAKEAVKACCCDEVQQPQLHVDTKKPIPTTLPIRCTHGVDGKGKNRCPHCGTKKLFSILKVLAESKVGEEEVEVMEWDEATRQGTNKSTGKQNTQRELTANTITVKELVKRFRKAVDVCIPHYQEICWIRIILDIDFATLGRSTLLIFTDFAAVMILRAYQAKNSSVDAHAINDNFICVYNRRSVNVVEKKKVAKEIIEISEEIEIFTTDVHHFFAETMSKGKKNDHAMHNACFDALIRHYKGVFVEMGSELRLVIFYTDNAPHQYRCRQTFIKTASTCERHPGIRVTHRLAVVDNFKGPHDSFGKDPAHLVKKLELKSPPIRSPTAEKVFVNCLNHIEVKMGESKWDEYERAGDYRLKEKGKFGMNSRRHWLAVETKEDFDRLNSKHPDRIVICDRSFILDTEGHKPVPGTKQLHEVRSTATAIPDGEPRVWPVTVSNMPCNCINCNQNPDNDLCTFKTFRNTRTVNLTVEKLHVGNIAAHEYIGDSIALDVEGVVYSGNVVGYDEDDELWLVELNDGSTDTMNYIELCEGKQLYDASNESGGDIGSNNNEDNS